MRGNASLRFLQRSWLLSSVMELTQCFNLGMPIIARTNISLPKPKDRSAGDPLIVSIGCEISYKGGSIFLCLSACVASNSWIATCNCEGWKGFASSYLIYSAKQSGNFVIILWWISRLPILVAAHESTNPREFWDAEGELWRFPIWTAIPGMLLSSTSGIGRVMGLPTLKFFPWE